MKYFLPDSQDLVDPSFDFETEERSRTRIRQRDDVYAHEIFSDRAYDGMLVSKSIVEGFGVNGSRYTMAQRHRLLRVGAPDFLRINETSWGPLPIMGDCGAFSYVKEETPPYTVEDLITFYLDCEFDLGISLDHVILEYEPAWDSPRGLDVDARKAQRLAKERQEMTLSFANDFLKIIRKNKLKFTPLGVAQGWSPKSYATAVGELQKMGYQYIALGGMVPLKTVEIEAVLAGTANVRDSKTRFHLLGVTRTEKLPAFSKFGVTSFDSTSPLRQAFKDDKDNYYTMDRTYAAIRIPQVQGNPKLERSIRAGKTSQQEARANEKACLDALARFDNGTGSLDEAVDTLCTYERLFAAAENTTGKARADHRDRYREVLEARPWKECPCAICKALGHHVIVFRGAERNRRRGLHNVWVFYRRVQEQLRQLRTDVGRTSQNTMRTRSSKSLEAT